MPSLAPFPSYIEVVRSLAGAVDTKNSEKWLDSQAMKWDFDFRSTEEAIKRVITKPLTNYIGADFAQFLTDFLTHSFTDYGKIVAKFSLDGLTRDQASGILAQHVFSFYGGFIVSEVARRTGGPNPNQLLVKGQTSIEALVGWAEQETPGWPEFLPKLQKVERDQIRRWRQGRELPKLISIKTLLDSKAARCTLTEADRAKLKALLVTARAIDSYRDAAFKIRGIDSALATADAPHSRSDIGPALTREALRTTQVLQPFAQRCALLAQGLSPQRFKAPDDRHAAKIAIAQLRNWQSEIDPKATTRYWLSWLEARWFVYNGELKQASAKYAETFEQCYFRAGPNQEIIMREALVVSTMLDSPPKTFLKKLRNAMVVLGLDTPLNPGMSGVDSSQFEDHVENWFIAHYQAHFPAVFPQDGAFPGIKYPAATRQSGMVLLDDSVKPNGHHPNRAIKIDIEKHKKRPQLVHYALMGAEDTVHRLLEAGADVNKLSENHESALLASVLLMDATDPAADPSDDSMFKALVKYPHDHHVLNVRTAKKRFSLLIAAINTQRMDVLETLLKLGCAPNFRGGVDLVTPLHFCVQRIATVKNPGAIENLLEKVPDDPVSLDAIRRYIGAPTGMTLPEVKRWLERQAEGAAFKTIRAAVGKILVESTLKGLDLSVLRAMAIRLIEHGADPNAEHAHPIKGYTPLMMAVEADEAEIVKAFVAAGGSLNKTYLDPNSGSRVSCYAIAKYFNAGAVLETVEHFQQHS